MKNYFYYLKLFALLFVFSSTATNVSAEGIITIFDDDYPAHKFNYGFEISKPKTIYDSNDKFNGQSISDKYKNQQILKYGRGHWYCTLRGSCTFFFDRKVEQEVNDPAIINIHCKDGACQAEFSLNTNAKNSPWDSVGK